MTVDERNFFDELADIVRNKLDKTGMISSTDLYIAMSDLCKKRGLPIMKFPNTKEA